MDAADDGGAPDGTDDSGPVPDTGAADCRVEGCPQGQRCDPATGNCEPIARCMDVQCLSNEICVAGECLQDGDGDGSPAREDCDARRELDRRLADAADVLDVDRDVPLAGP
jgi:hypothetical protein